MEKKIYLFDSCDYTQAEVEALTTEELMAQCDLDRMFTADELAIAINEEIVDLNDCVEYFAAVDDNEDGKPLYLFDEYIKCYDKIKEETLRKKYSNRRHTLSDIADIINNNSLYASDKNDCPQYYAIAKLK